LGGVKSGAPLPIIWRLRAQWGPSRDVVAHDGIRPIILGASSWSYMSQFLRPLLWFIVGAAALAWLAPGPAAAFAQGAVAAGCVVALLAWRLSVRRLQQAAQTSDTVEPAPVPPDSALELALALARVVQDADSLESALRGTAHWWRCELGARTTSVHWVWDLATDEHAVQVQLGETPPGGPIAGRRPRSVRLDDGALGQALREGRVVADPRGGWVMPVTAARRRVAVLQLGDVGLPLAPSTVRGLLELARSALARRALEVRPSVDGRPAKRRRCRPAVRSLTVRAGARRGACRPARGRRECRNAQQRVAKGVCLAGSPGVGHNRLSRGDVMRAGRGGRLARGHSAWASQPAQDELSDRESMTPLSSNSVRLNPR